MRSVVLDRWQDVVAHARAWDECVASCGSASVFQSFAWNDAWWNAFGEQYGCAVILIYDGELLVGVAPFARDGARLVWIAGANRASDYCDLIVRDGARRDDILDETAIQLERLAWNELDLSGVREGAISLELAARLESRGLHTLSFSEVDCPARVLGNPTEDAALMSKKSLKRHFQKMQSLPGFSFQHLESESEVRAELDGFFAQHIARRALAGEPSLFHDPRQRRLYELALAPLLAAGHLRFAIVRSRGTTVAYHYGFEWRGAFIWYKPSFHPDFSKESPGEVLLRCLFSDCIDRGLTEFDFTVGDEAFKYRFANRIRRNHRIRAWRSRLRRDLYRLRRGASAAIKSVRRWRLRAREGA